MSKERPSLEERIRAAERGNYRQGYSLLSEVEQFLTAGEPLPPALASYHAKCLRRITDPNEEEWTQDPWLYHEVKEYLTDDFLNVKNQAGAVLGALNIRRPKGQPPKDEDIERAQRYLLAYELSSVLQRLQEEHRQWKTGVMQEMDFRLKQLRDSEVELSDSLRAEMRLLSNPERFLRKCIAREKEIRRDAKEEVAEKHSVKVPEIEESWRLYGAGSRSNELSDEDFGEPETFVKNWIESPRKVEIDIQTGKDGSVAAVVKSKKAAV